jgi:DNA-binding helix-hairpin-helix protein with protein kinase domain
MGFSKGAAFSLFFLSLLVGSGVVASSAGYAGPPSRTLRALRIEWERALTQWRKHSSSSLYMSARSKLEKSRQSLRALAEQQHQELDRLKRLLEPRQRQTFLDAFEIEKALFYEVTPSNVEKLASHGIRSAGDIRSRRDMLYTLIPLTAVTELRTWAAQCAKDFKFEPGDATYVADAAQIEEKYQRQRQPLLEELRHGPALLTAKRDEVADARARAEDMLRRTHENLRQRRGKVNE